MASERLELSCKISRADVPVRWYKDSLEVQEGPNLIMETDGSHRRLVIPMPGEEDTGEYVCDTEDDSVAFLVTVKGETSWFAQCRCHLRLDHCCFCCLQSLP